MSAKQIARGLIGLNVLGWVTNTALHYMGMYEPKVFGTSIQITVALFLAGALYFYRNPSNTKWFGAKLEPHSDVSQTISFVASCICTLPPLMFNVYPIVTRCAS